MSALIEDCSGQKSAHCAAAPAGALLVPNALRERLARYAGIAERSHGPGRTGSFSVVGMAARLETARVAMMLAERLFAVKVTEEDALRQVVFSRDFFLVWIRAIEPCSAEVREGEGRAA